MPSKQAQERHALEHSQPVLPMGLDYVEGVTHDSCRHGTTRLFAVPNAACGTALTLCQPRHRHQEFPAFLRHIDGNVPSELGVHRVIDNPPTHTPPPALPRAPRPHLRLLAQSGGTLVRSRYSAGNPARLIHRRPCAGKAIQHRLEHDNRDARPFAWTATSESILAKLERLMKVINGTWH